jgi:integrase / recombinase
MGYLGRKKEIGNKKQPEAWVWASAVGWRGIFAKVSDCVIQRIKEYLQSRSNSLVKVKVNYLFTNRYGNKITNSTVRLHLHNLANELLVDKLRPTPHMLKHSCATHFIRQTHDLRFVQILLGHSSVATTQMYTHLDNDFVKATFYQHLNR